MANETMVKVQSLRNDAVNGRFATELGVVTFDADGIALVPVNIGAALYAHPDFTVPDAKDETAVKEHIDKKFSLPEGYDPGEMVRGRCAELAGANATACVVDAAGAEVSVKATFGADGYAVMGIHVAEALKASMGDAFTFEPTEEAKKGRLTKTEQKALDQLIEKEAAEKEAADKLAADNAAKEAAVKVLPVVSTEIPQAIKVK